jgi:4-carboxymuconolactone decarboxylase
MTMLRFAAAVFALFVAGSFGYALGQSAAPLPADVYADSRNRLPLVKREDLDDAGKKMYDQTAGDARSLVGLQGPGGIRLYSPHLDVLTRAVNQYLRFDAGLDPRLGELAILVVAREMDQRFEWYAHEAAGLKQGLDPAIIDVIRYRKPIPPGAGEKEAVLIKLGRGALGAHRVDAATFAQAVKIFGAQTMLNYVELMGAYSETSVLLTTFNQQLPPGATSHLPVK